MKTFIFLLMVGSSACFAQSQNNVSGKITDASNGKPIEFATVFLAKTMIGTRTDEHGTYNLKNIPPGKYDVTVSCVGYKMKRAAVLIQGTITGLNVPLTPDVAVLRQVDVKTSRSEYLKMVKLFEQYFIGRTGNANDCIIKNIDAIDFDYDKLNGLFSASCNVPIEVENKALNYRIFYIMEQFTVDFNSHVSTMEGIPRFEELRPDANNEQKIMKARNRAYYGSINHFMRSLREKKLYGNDFELSSWRRQYVTETKQLTSSPKYGFYPLSVTDLYSIRPDSLLELRIVYKGATADFNYDPKKYKLMELQTSLLYYRKHALIIHENGYYDSPLDFIIQGYWTYRENIMAELLPLEYQPIITEADRADMARLEEEGARREAKRKQLDIQ